MEAARRPSNKKRHTKPCAFYQTMQCPFTAEECNFSHVLTNGGFCPRVPIPSSRAKVCKYFHAGTCTQGYFCRFKHPSGQELYPNLSEEVNDTTHSAFAEGDDITKPHKHLSRPVVAVPSFPPDFVPSHGWPPYVYNTGIQSPVFSPGYYIPHNLLSPTHTRGSSDSTPTLPSSESDHSSNSTNESDDVVVTMDDLDSPSSEWKSNSPSASCLPPEAHAFSPVCIPHSPPLAVSPTVPRHVRYFSQPTSTPRSGRSRSQSHGKSKSKAISYKTKPCRYFKLGSNCPLGDECTFAHDESDGNEVRTVSPKSERLSTSPSNKKPMHDLPPKPTSVYEESRKKGFFPITWRVIGGGVMMGGKRTVCQWYLEGKCKEGIECRYSHDDPDGQIVESMAALSPMLDGPGDPTTPKPGETMYKEHPAPMMKEDRRRSLPHPLRLVPNPTPRVVVSNGSDLEDTVMTPRTAKTRPISMSNPTTPRVDVSSLFASAESP